MLRTSRNFTAVVCRLTSCTAGIRGIGKASAVMVLAAAALMGCSDESQPEYWVKKLDDPASRPAAIKRLTQFYEDGMVKSNNDRDTPEMKTLMGKIVAPMSKAYVTGDLDEKTRVDLLKALTNTRDPGAKDAVIKAISDFAAGKDTAEEMRQAALYIKQVKPKEAAGPLLDAFLKIHVSDPKLGPPYKATEEAMLAIADPSWSGKLVEMLNRPIDVKNVQEGRNEVYWQTVSAEALGELKASEAVRPLFKVVLTPDKKDIAPTAVVAITKIGKPAVPTALNVLSAKDAELLEFAKSQAGGEPSRAMSACIANAGIVLGTIGRGEALGPMADALNKSTDDSTRAVLGREMSKLPASPEAIRALEGAYEKVSPSAILPSGEPARVVMAEAAGSFMDSSIVPWLLKQTREAKGDAEEKDAVQAALLQTALKVMKKDQVDDVKKLIDIEGSPIDKDAFKLASDILNACTDNLGCYFAKLEDPAAQDKNHQFTGIKAAYMLGMLGKDGTKAEIIKRLPKVKNSAIRFVGIMAIDHLSPQGDNKSADELQQILDADMARGDQTTIQADAPIKQIVPRLRARAAP